MSVSGACALRSLGKSSSKSVRAADGSGDGESTSDSTSRSTRARWVGTVRVGVPARRMEASKVRPPSGSLRTRTCCHQPVGSEKSSRRWRPGRSSRRRSAVKESASSPLVKDDAEGLDRLEGAVLPQLDDLDLGDVHREVACRRAGRWPAARPVSSACTLSRTGRPPWPVPMSRLERLSLPAPRCSGPRPRP